MSCVHQVDFRASVTPGTTWMAEAEPLSIFIDSMDGSFPAAVYDRRLHCRVELPVECDLDSAKKSALIYAQEYMRACVGEASWTSPEPIEWHEFTTVRSQQHLDQLKEGMRTLGPVAVPRRLPGRMRERHPEPAEASGAAGVRLFLSLAEASRYTGLSAALLARKIRLGELPALRDRAWKIRKSDLDKL